jgi:hypothetical protein
LNGTKPGGGKDEKLVRLFSCSVSGLRAICIAGGIMAGRWLGGDNPGFVILGLFIGLALAFYGVYR